jgi:hypothetical protein
MSVQFPIGIPSVPWVWKNPKPVAADIVPNHPPNVKDYLKNQGIFCWEIPQNFA